MRRRPKRQSLSVAEPVDPPVPGRRWYGLYTGSGAAGAPTWTGPESSLLIVGPPRSGKTSSVVVPCVLDAPAAVVSTSTKPDVLAATCLRRYALGECYVFDPTGSVTLPPGIHLLRWSPVTGCRRFERAVATAHALAGAARPGAPLSEAAHWVERAEALLAPMLFAADSAGADMAALCRWVLGREVAEPLRIIEASGHELARATLGGVAATEDRERSGIFSTAAGLLSAYRSEAALAQTQRPNFDPLRFACSSDALYVCAPAEAQDRLAPIVITLLEQVRHAVYARPPGAAPVVFALDEVANIAPLPALPSMAAEGGGHALVTLACLQDLSQARARWGDEADGFFSLFNYKLIFPGVADQRTLSLVSALAGEEQILVRSVTRPRVTILDYGKQIPPGSTTTSVIWRPRLPADQVSKGRAGNALRIGPDGMRYVGTVPWWNHHHWGPVTRAQGSLEGEAVRPTERYELAAPSGSGSSPWK